MEMDLDDVAKIFALVVCVVTSSFFFHRAITGPRVCGNGILGAAFGIVSMMVWFSLGS